MYALGTRMSAGLQSKIVTVFFEVQEQAKMFSGCAGAPQDEFIEMYSTSMIGGHDFLDDTGAHVAERTCADYGKDKVCVTRHVD